MATLQKRIAEWTSIGKDVAQIIALMGVGLWTLFVYLRTESPSTAGQMDTTASFASSPLDDGGCELRFNFAVQNKGRTSARIERLRIRGWSLDEITARADTPRILSAHDVHGSPPIVDQGVQQTILLSELPPGEAVNDSFIILLPRGHARRVLMDGAIDVTIPGIFGSTRRSMNAYIFDRVCDISSSSADVTTARPK
jgi:hypothetical protein